MYQTSGLWTDFPLGPMTSTQTKLSPALTPTLLLAPRWIYRPPHSPALTPSSPDQTRPNPHDAPPRANKQDAYQGSQPEEAVAVAAADSTTRCQQTGGMLLSVSSVPDATSRISIMTTAAAAATFVSFLLSPFLVGHG